MNNQENLNLYNGQYLQPEVISYLVEHPEKREELLKNLPSSLRDAYNTAINNVIIEQSLQTDPRMIQSPLPFNQFNSEKPKQLIKKNPQEHGFISALFLTIITFAFGILCVTYMFSSIFH